MDMAYEANSSTAIHRVCKEPDMSLKFVLGTLSTNSGHLTCKDSVLRLLIDSTGGIQN